MDQILIKLENREISRPKKKWEVEELWLTTTWSAPTGDAMPIIKLTEMIRKCVRIILEDLNSALSMDCGLKDGLAAEHHGIHKGVQ
jgi:hypothetical protein